MHVPKPPVKLEGHCSVVHDNTLYTLSSKGFYALALEEDAKWEPQSTKGAELVSDAVCVTGGIDGNEQKKALYVVGGTNDGSDAPGLQRYSFDDNTWKSLHLDPDTLANRTGHKAVYLPGISSILTYGGSTVDGSSVSAESFICDTAKTYNCLSRDGYAFPTSWSILLAWSDYKAVLLGGQSKHGDDDSWKKPRFFTQADQWHDEGYDSLNIDFSENTRAALIHDPNGTLLQTFAMNQDPVDVTGTLLSNGTSGKRKRDVEIPDYDSQFAPTSTPNGYSFAQGDDSENPLVVISGGSGSDTVSIFNQTGNSWVNSTKLFYGDKSEQDILESTPSSSPTPSATSSAFAPLPTSHGEDDHVGTILGATLGSLMGVAVILVLVLFYIKRKKEKAHQARGMDKDGRLSFQDQGVEPLTRSAYPMAKSQAPRAAASMDSLAMFSGTMGDEKTPKGAGSLPQHMQKTQPNRPSPLNNIQSSGDSEYSLDDKAIDAGESPIRRTTDEGWGKYFQDNSTPTLVGINSPYDSTRGSKATIWPGGNNTLPPLDTSFLRQPTPLGRVNSGSPTTGDGRQIMIPESQSARISSASAESDDEDGDRYHGAREQSWLGRPPSSAYSRSFYNPSSRPDAPSTAAPSVDYRRHDSARTNTRGSSILIPDGQPLPRNNVNSDMSWLNLNAER
ncbi:hypothetical protein BDV18DRAFT_132519 [Aspergillus unguis]